MKDNMLRLIYGEMMGQDVQFGAIYALKLAQSGQTVAEKRAGEYISKKSRDAFLGFWGVATVRSNLLFFSIPSS